MQLEAFDLITYLQEREVVYAESGQRNVSKGWIGVACPWCDDASTHLGIHLQSKRLSCWRCGVRGDIVKYIMHLEQCRYQKAKEIIEQYLDFTTSLIPIQQPIKSPTEDSTFSLAFHKFFSRAFLPVQFEYLLKRRYDPVKLMHDYDLYFCHHRHLKFKFHIIIPVKINDVIVSFQGMAIGKQGPRYQACPSSWNPPQDIKSCLYNIDTVRDVAMIVEGATDVWRLGPGAVCTFGTQWTMDQALSLTKRGITKAIVIFDSEPEALRQANKLAATLSGFISSVEVLELPKGQDPDSLTDEEIQNLRNLFV